MNQPVSPMVLRENVLLAPFTTLGVGGPARFFVEAEDEVQVVDALDFASVRNLPVFILGGGSNLVVADSGFQGMVLRIGLRGIQHETAGRIVAASGENWDSLVSQCVEQGLAGIECLSGIPGTVGGTPVQNVGAYGQEVSEVIASVRVLERKTRKTLDLDNAACGFSYRTSLFNGSERDRYVVLAVAFRLRPGAGPRIAYPELQRRFEGRTDMPTLADVRAAVLRIRESKSMVFRSGDRDSKSAGSFFRNPIVSECEARFAEEAAMSRGSSKDSLNMPRYPMGDGRVKLSAAWLIEHAGFSRGYCRGQAGLSSKHALAIINRGGAAASEILALMEEIQAAVDDLFQVKLVPEPVFVGFG
jgi:UDP-N-acetylmuramate dehydrogenase